MSDANKDVKFCLKVVINKQKTKVLFAEADSDFIDVLISFLTLPLGTIVKVLKEHYGDKAPVIGSLTTLYNGLANLDSYNFWLMCGRACLLNRNCSLGAKRVKLKLNIDDTEPKTNTDCKRKRSPIVRESNNTQAADDADGYGGVFTVNTVSFVVSDDLQITPVVLGSLLQTLINLGITDTDGAEPTNLTFGLNEIMDLLKASLLSRTPLSDLIFRERAQINSVTQNLQQRVQKESPSNYKKMTVNAMVQKSNNKVLFALAGDDFINYLSCFLTFTLAGVERFLGNNTCLKNIDNLYKSIVNINGDNYLKTKDTKEMLLKPQFIYENHIPPIDQKGLSNLNQMSPFHTKYFSPVIFPKGEGNYVKGQRMYKVTDDLIVTPFCMASSFCILSSLKVPLSDVKELELEIGLDEALSILKASLTSTSALTNGLMNLISKKQPKQEH